MMRAFLWIILSFLSYSSVSFAQPGDEPGQAIQIRTDLHSFEGKPSWLIIVRNMDTGAIMPYLFDFDGGQNTWVEIIFARHYRIIESTMNFGPPPCAKIRNFCHLEDGILTNQSFSIAMSGDLTPNRYTSICHVNKFKDYDFPIVEQTPPPPAQTQESSNALTETPQASPIPLSPAQAAGVLGNPQATAAVSNAIESLLPK